MVFKGTNAVPPSHRPRMDSVGGCWTPSPPKSKSVSRQSLDDILPSPRRHQRSLPTSALRFRDVKNRTAVVLEEIRWTWTIPNIFSMKPLRAVFAGPSSRVPFSARRKLLKSFTEGSPQSASANGCADHLLVNRCGQRHPLARSPNRRKAVRSSQALRRSRRHVARRPARLPARRNPISSRFISASAFLSPHRPRPPLRRRRSHNLSARHVLAPLPKYPGKARPRLRRLQRSHSLLRRRHVTVYAAPQKKPSARLWISAIAEFRAPRNARPRKNFSAPKSPQGLAHAPLESTSSRMSNLARQTLFRPLLHPRRNSCLHRSRHSRGLHPSPRTLPPEQISATVLAPSTASPSTAAASPAEIFFHGRSVFPSLTAQRALR